MLEVITAKRSWAYAPRSQIWPEYKLKAASCFLLELSRWDGLDYLMSCILCLMA